MFSNCCTRFNKKASVAPQEGGATTTEGSTVQRRLRSLIGNGQHHQSVSDARVVARIDAKAKTKEGDSMNKPSIEAHQKAPVLQVRDISSDPPKEYDYGM